MTTYKDAYNEMLDDCGAPFRVGSMTYPASSTLEEVDPTAYRCGFADWTDSLTCGDCGRKFSADVSMEDEYAPQCEDCATEEESEDE